MRGWSRQAAAIAAAGCCGVGCFADIGPSPAGSSSTGAATSSAVTGGGAPTSGTTSASTTSASTTTGGNGSTGGPDPTTGASGGPGGTTTGAATTGAPVCPALDAFMSPQVADAACEACLRQQCCAEFEACAGECAGVWNCAHGQDCLAAWADCPGFDAHKSVFDAANDCMNTVCHEVCNIGPCADAVVACDADPECGAIGTCSAACVQDCPDCLLECWAMCKEQHPEGAAEFDAFWTCVAEQCS